MTDHAWQARCLLCFAPMARGEARWCSASILPFRCVPMSYPPERCAACHVYRDSPEAILAPCPGPKTT